MAHEALSPHRVQPTSSSSRLRGITGRHQLDPHDRGDRRGGPLRTAHGARHRSPGAILFRPTDRVAVQSVNAGSFGWFNTLISDFSGFLGIRDCVSGDRGDVSLPASRDAARCVLGALCRCLQRREHHRSAAPPERAWPTRPSKMIGCGYPSGHVGSLSGSASSRCCCSPATAAPGPVHPCAGCWRPCSSRLQR